MTLGEIIKAARESRGMTPKALSACSGIDLSTIYRIEKGDISDIKCSLLQKLCKALHMSPNELLQWNGHVADAGAQTILANGLVEIKERAEEILASVYQRKGNENEPE